MNQISPQRPWRILVVDDNSEDAEATAGRLDSLTFCGLPVEAVPCSSFDEAFKWLESRSYDIAVLDLVDGSGQDLIGLGRREEGGEADLSMDAGERLLKLIQQSRPLPVIFLTAHPSRIEDKVNLITKLVSRSDSTSKLEEAIKTIFESGVPTLARRIEDIQRSYLWDFVASHSNDIERGGVTGELAMLLSRRLAFLLREEYLGDQNAGKVRPVELYIFPEPGGDPRSGALLKCRLDNSWWLLLTPSCDLVSGGRERKAGRVLLARCEMANEHFVVKTYKQDQGKENVRKVRDMIDGRIPQADRHFFLPEAFEIPGLFADFQYTKSIPYSDFERDYERIATLDSPYAEAALNRYTRYFGRIGTRDHDVEWILEQMKTDKTKV